MKKKDFILLFILFVFIFQPPFFPVPLIYLIGPIVIIKILKEKRSKNLRTIAKYSNLYKMTRFFLVMTLYVIVINALDIIIVGDKGVFLTRLRSLNQVCFLTLSEFACICYLLLKFNKYHYSFDDAMGIIIKAAVVQGFCAILAFLLPPIREIFMMFGDRTLYSNTFFLERRGYGFSMILIDTFGYGMGLMAGYVILYKWKRGFDKYLFFSLLLILFTIVVNARTGILVFLIAISVKVLYCNNMTTFFNKFLPVSICIVLIYLFLPKLLEFGVKSENNTISWVSASFMSILEYAKDGSSSDSIEDFAFLSTFINLPSNPFELVFGAGHHVYDTEATMGFRTDIGYFNMFWELGIFGSFVMLGTMFLFMIKPFFISKNISIKQIALFNTISYFLVQMKAILIGYNPGVFVNYLVAFTLYYYLWKETVHNNYFEKIYYAEK